MKKDILFRLLFVVVIISLDKEFAFAEDSKIVLGRKLYFDTQLSVDNDISCNSCHDLKNFGVDSNPTSPGHKGQQGERNSPTVYNAALHFTQFWDGRAKDVEEQALGPVLNPIEMAMPSEEEVVKRLKANPEYLDLFKQSFPEKDPITFINMGKAIGAFERTLVTKSRFDKWKAGDSNALSPEEVKAGAKARIVVGGLMRQALSYDVLAMGSLLVQGGASFIATNYDSSFPSELGLLPGAGAVLSVVERSSGVSPTVIGKPNTIMFEEALRRLGTAAADTVMLGDRLNTDIEGGKKVGMQTILVLSGVSSLEDVERSSLKPDYTFQDIAALSKALA